MGPWQFGKSQGSALQIWSSGIPLVLFQIHKVFCVPRMPAAVLTAAEGCPVSLAHCIRGIFGIPGLCPSSPLPKLSSSWRCDLIRPYKYDPQMVLPSFTGMHFRAGGLRFLPLQGLDRTLSGFVPHGMPASKRAMRLLKLLSIFPT